eukprot:scaffold719_cov226-Pinguiococcus_pyrenoidosus.AAC.3
MERNRSAAAASRPRSPIFSHRLGPAEQALCAASPQRGLRRQSRLHRRPARLSLSPSRRRGPNLDRDDA